MTNTPLVLLVIDGFGLSPQQEGNAIAAANIPNIKRLITNYPVGALEAAGMAVGVMWGEPGNSEVGHIGIGAGQVVYQNLPRVQLAIEDKSFYTNPEFLAAIEYAKAHQSALHLMGLASSGGVHAHIEHLERLLECCHNQNFSNVFIHMITDGRDTAAQKALEFVEQIEQAQKKFECGRIATVMGRFYAMDRNANWDRTKRAYEAITEGKGTQASSARDAIQASYSAQKFDEEIEPAIIVSDGKPLRVIEDHDALIFFNYREDRARQLTKTLAVPDFKDFIRSKTLNDLYFVTMIEYEKGLPVHIAFPPQFITQPFGKTISDAGARQLRIAETEKYAHVTYFFNGGSEQEFPGETRVMIPSKKVDSYSTVPEMSAREIIDRVIKELQSGAYHFILINLANPDMVGHTGDFAATVKAVEITDECVGKLASAVESMHGTLAITADHGNAEQKIDPMSHKPSKEHTANPVPFIFTNPSCARIKSAEECEAFFLNPTPIGILADIAPTLLEYLNLPPPPEMTGKSLMQYLQ